MVNNGNLRPANGSSDVPGDEGPGIPREDHDKAYSMRVWLLESNLMNCGAGRLNTWYCYPPVRRGPVVIVLRFSEPGS